VPLTFRSPSDTVIFNDSDMPEQVPLGAQLSGEPQLLSDGSHLLPLTGETPSDVQLQGTLRYDDRAQGMTRLQKIQRIERMRSRMETVHVSPWVGDVLISDVEYSIVRDGEITYVITLFRQVAGALSTQNLDAQTFAPSSVIYKAQTQMTKESEALSAASQQQMAAYRARLQTYLNAKGSP
jgi:hypothetical protein